MKNKKPMDQHRENEKTNPLMRREFLKAASVLGLGTLASGAQSSFGAVPQHLEHTNSSEKNIGTILTKKEHEDQKKSAYSFGDPVRLHAFSYTKPIKYKQLK
ncbi:hypothetical protein [Pedobacter sp.]|uniref:hypothetical protein n=1 Tax=Pedobacter sp. TaxID=1411316 RepID=UPI003D7FEA6F